MIPALQRQFLTAKDRYTLWMISAAAASRRRNAFGVHFLRWKFLRSVFNRLRCCLLRNKRHCETIRSEAAYWRRDIHTIVKAEATTERKAGARINFHFKSIETMKHWNIKHTQLLDGFDYLLIIRVNLTRAFLPLLPNMSTSHPPHCDYPYSPSALAR